MFENRSNVKHDQCSRFRFLSQDMPAYRALLKAAMSTFTATTTTSTTNACTHPCTSRRWNDENYGSEIW